MPVSKFPRLTMWFFCKRRPFLIFDQFRELFTEINGKTWGFALRKKGIGKTPMVKLVKCCHQVTCAQKRMTKKRA